MKRTIIIVVFVLIHNIYGNAQSLRVNSFTLIDPFLDTDIRTLAAVDTITSNATLSLIYNIRANTSGSVGSVHFEFKSNGSTVIDKVENVSPYALGGDNQGDYNLLTFSPGSYTLTATPYTGSNKTGTKGTALTIQLTILPIHPGEVTSLTLVDYTWGTDIRPVNPGKDTLSIGGYYGTIRANTSGSIGSVRFEWSKLDGSGYVSRYENVAPYAVGGDINGIYQPWWLWPGTYRFSATPYSGPNGTGEKGVPYVVELFVPDPMPDLKIDAYINVDSVGNGGVLTGGITLINEGGLAADTSTVGVYLSQNSVYDNNDVLISKFSFPTIDQSYSNHISPFITIPATTAPGNYYLIYRADIFNNVNEMDESNNDFIKQIKVYDMQVDLTIFGQGPQDSITRGQTVYLSYDVTATGNSIVLTSVSTFLSTDAILDSNDVLLTYEPDFYVEPGSIAGNSRSITIPDSIPLGNYYFIYYVDAVHSINETNENNNTFTRNSTIVLPGPDLESYIAINSPAIVGESLSNLYYFNNIGSESAGPSSTGIFLSKDTIRSEDDIVLLINPFDSIAANTLQYHQLNITIPSNVLPGDYNMIVVTDLYNQVTEISELNNIITFPISILESTDDIGIDHILIPFDIITQGSHLTISYETNNGNQAVYADIKMVISSDTIYDESDLVIGMDTATLYQNTLTKYINVSIPEQLSAGDYTLILVADYNNAVAETNENNNISKADVHISNGTPIFSVPAYGRVAATTCSGVLTDHAPIGNYANKIDGIFTIYPEVSGNKVRLDFEEFQTEFNYDYLYIFDGPNENYPFIGAYDYNPGTVQATNAEGALTLRFMSDNSVVYAGFKANISCVNEAAETDISENARMSGSCSADLTKVIAYPNPTEGRFTVSVKNTEKSEEAIEITVYSSSGNVVAHKSNPATPEASFDLSGYPAGIYAVKVEINGEQSIHQVVVE